MMKTSNVLIFGLCFFLFICSCKKDRWYANQSDTETESLVVTVPRTEVVKKGVCCTYVKLYLSVTNQNGEPISGLNQYSFEVTQRVDAYETERKSFTLDIEEPQQKQLALALTMDYSGSMSSSDVQMMENAVAQFIQNKTVSDQMEIIKFADTAFRVVGFTTDKQTLLDAVYEPFSGGATAFYDAMMIALNDGEEILKQDPEAIVAVINYSDGYENNSLSYYSDVTGTANANGIPVFSIGFGSVNTAVLQNLADDTGGRYYPPPPTASELTGLYNLIKGQLVNLYVIEFVISLPPNKYVTFDIDVTYECAAGILESVVSETIVTK